MHATLRQQRIDATSERMRIHIVSLALAAIPNAAAISPR
jgi:hypothetical protein